MPVMIWLQTLRWSTQLPVVIRLDQLQLLVCNQDIIPYQTNQGIRMLSTFEQMVLYGTKACSSTSQLLQGMNIWNDCTKILLQIGNTLQRLGRSKNMSSWHWRKGGWIISGSKIKNANMLSTHTKGQLYVPFNYSILLNFPWLLP